MTEPLSSTETSISYWLRTASAPMFSSELPAMADVVVIGGGWLGAATCYWLARAGVNVVLLEQMAFAYGATGRNGGFLSLGTAESYPDVIQRVGHETARAVWNVTLENRTLVRQVLEEEQIACHYRESGHISLALNEEQSQKQRQTVAALQADGFRAELLRREQVQELIYTPLGSAIVGAKFLPESGLLHSAQLVYGVIQAAMKYKARTSIAQVQHLMQDGDSVRIETAQGNIYAGAVVVAVNAWTSQLLPALATLITPVRGQVLSYAPNAPTFTAGLGAAITATGEYWQQAIDGSIILGGCRAVAPEGDVGILDSVPTPEVQSALERVLPTLFPQLDNLHLEQRWAGLMGFTPDYIPVADAVPGLVNAWMVGGFCGHGMPFGLRLGQLLAKAVTKGIRPVEMWPFQLDRITLHQGKNR